MTQKNPSGYPLPSGELGEDDIVCQLVYLPDRPEYWQALYGALSYMATWKAWERDVDKRGKDAASDWQVALELTTECWRMACLEALSQNVEDILTFLNTKKDCCDDNLTYEPVEEITTDIVPNDGDAPTHYGETAVADWDEWNEYLCYTAHKYVDYLAHTGDELYALARFGSIGLGVVAGLMALLVASGIGIPIAVGTAAAIVSGITLLGVLTTFEDSHDDIEAARDLIVCAILNDWDIGEVVETALASDLSWDLWYSLVPYESAKAIMYEGGNDGEYLPAELKDDCASCDLPEGYNWVDAEEIQYTLHPDNYGRVNSANVSLPNITVGYTVASSGSFGCSTYPAGCSAMQATNDTYQTLAIRITLITNEGNKDPYIHLACRSMSETESFAYYWTFDVAEGIDSDWADTQSDTWQLGNSGHAKRAIGYDWLTGSLNVCDTVPGQTPIYVEVKVEHLVWVP